MKKLLLSIFVLSAGSSFAQWTVQNTEFGDATRGILSIDIVDPNTVWCLSYDGTGVLDDTYDFTRTTDGGNDWNAGIIDLGDPTLKINNLSAVSGDAAWVSSIDGELYGSLYKTTDGGSFWEFANPEVAGQTTPSFNYTDESFQNVVHFFDANNGLVQGDPVSTGGPASEFEIYRTSNATADPIVWTRVPAASLPNPQSGEYGYNNGNVGAGNFFWFVTNKGRIYRTPDMGVTWTVSNSPYIDFGAAAVNARMHMSDVTGNIATAVGVIIGTTNGNANPATNIVYTRWTTADGGATWTNAGTFTEQYRNMEFIPGTSMLVATGNNSATSPTPVYTTAYSTDLGATWTEISNDNIQRTSIAFYDGATGWAGGFNEDSTTGGIFKYAGASLGLPSVGERQQFSATPNPTNGNLQVANETAAITDVVVYDLLGKQVYKGKFSALNQVDLDLTPLNTGNYILKATSETGATQTIKIVKN